MIGAPRPPPLLLLLLRARTYDYDCGHDNDEQCLVANLLVVDMTCNLEWNGMGHIDGVYAWERFLVLFTIRGPSSKAGFLLQGII